MNICDPSQEPLSEPPFINLPQNPISNNESTTDEQESAIKSLRNGKTRGLDNIMAQVVKAGGNRLMRQHTLLNHIWKSENIPSRWEKVIIVSFFKKETDRNARNIVELACS